MQTRHLTQPDKIVVTIEGTGVIWADGCVGSSWCRLGSHGVLALLP
jgi:hypothetical protein